MSADAKIWKDGALWHGINDMNLGDDPIHDYSLSHLIAAIEERENEGREMRWEIKVYPDGQAGLAGYCV